MSQTDYISEDENKERLNGLRVCFITLGCKVNSYETDAMIKLLKDKGAVIVSEDEAADICVVNTCSVTNVADRKSRQMLHRVRKLNPYIKIIATGCYAQIGGEKLLESGDADAVLGNNHKGEVAPVAARLINGENKILIEDDIAKERYCEETPIESCDERTRAFIKIEDGCNQFCSYCIIPYARGRVRSRGRDEILDEVKVLAERGYREVVLTGIHLSSYGVSNYEDIRTKGFDYRPLLELIKDIAATDGIKRIRLGSLEPRIICREFAEELAGIKEFCPQFHLALQSGSNSVLKRMNRHYTNAEFAEKCEIIKSVFNKPAITTDVIAGFPGETDEEFEESMVFIQKTAFAKMHIFKYSRRKGTVADRMPGQVDERIKAVRSQRIIELECRLRNEYMAGFIGMEDEIFFEEIVEIDGKKYALGLNTRYMPCLVQCGDDILATLAGRFVTVEYTGILNEEYLLSRICSL